MQFSFSSKQISFLLYDISLRRTSERMFQLNTMYPIETISINVISSFQIYIYLCISYERPSFYLSLHSERTNEKISQEILFHTFFQFCNDVARNIMWWWRSSAGIRWYSFKLSFFSLPERYLLARVPRRWMLNDIEMEIAVALALELNTFSQYRRSMCDCTLQWVKWMFFHVKFHFFLRLIDWKFSASNAASHSRWQSHSVSHLREFGATISKVNNHNSPEQNFGSSLRSPQWSMPSQYLSSGTHNPLPLHGNSEILHDRIKITKFNNRMPQAVSVSRRMICKIVGGKVY